jgi:ABC-type antimicrobial peptide transport system permease subunit
LGQALPFGGGNFGAKYVVVGVLEPIPALRQLEDGSYNAALLRAIEYDTSIFANPEKILLETTPQAFMGTQKKLNDWLLAQDINTHFEVVRLADQYGLALREKTVRLLGGALFFGVLAVFIAALTNLMGYFLARALERIGTIGIRRALGASRSQIVREELWQALPLVGLGLLSGIPLAFLLAGFLGQHLGLSVLPGVWALLGIVLGLSALVMLAAYVPSVWAVRQSPIQTIRGVAAHLPKWRGVLSGLGLALGVAGLVLQSATAQSAVLETERLIGRFASRVGIFSSGLGAVNPEAFTDPRGQLSLQKKMYRALLRQPFAQNYSRVGYSASLPNIVRGQNGDVDVGLRVYRDDFPALAGMQLLEGRMPQNGEEAVVGEALARELDWNIGRSLTLQDRTWRVVGIFRGGEERTLGNLSSRTVLVDEQYYSIRGFGNILLEVKPDLDVNAELQKAAVFINQNYGSPDLIPLKPYRPIDLAPDIRATLEQLAAVYGVLSWALLLLGGGGLIAQLFASLKRRTKEIGLYRALGATRGHVFWLFEHEGGRLGVLASVIGMVLGLVFAWVSAWGQGVVFAPDCLGTSLAGVAAVVLAVLCSVLPANAATKIPPAQAMRLEG